MADINVDDLIGSMNIGDLQEEENENEENWDFIANENNSQPVDEGLNNDAGVDVAQKYREMDANVALRQEARNQEMKNKREEKELKKRKRIRFSPPGLKIFNPEFLIRFKESNLDIERDFGYSKRNYLREKCKMSDETIEELFKTPWKFIMYLSPASSSPLIRNEDDFVKIADYLFFMLVSTKNFTMASVIKKALFTMLKNYAYTGWKLGLKHILPALLNLGIEEKAVLNQDEYAKMLDFRLKKLEMEFDIMNFLPKFFTDRLEGNVEIPENDTPESDDEDEKASTIKCSYIDLDSDGEDDSMPDDYPWTHLKYSLVCRCIKVICDLIITFPNLTHLVPPKNGNCIESLVGFYILSTVATDCHLIMDSKVWNDITNAFHIMLDGYPREWWVNDDNRASEESISICISEVFTSVGDFADAQDLRPWFSDEVPHNLESTDHHHNVCRRINLIPQTRRGNIIRKMVAHFHLQRFTAAKDTMFSRIPLADAEEAKTLLEQKKNVMESLWKELYLMMSFVNLLDVMVGNEPLFDFMGQEKQKNVEFIQSYLESQSQRRLNPMVGSRDIIKLRELIKQTLAKWEILKTSAKEAKQQKLPKTGSSKSKSSKTEIKN